MLKFLPLLLDIQMFPHVLEGAWQPLEKFAKE